MDGAAAELLRLAVARRAAGDGEAARAAYVRAFDAARAAGDVEALTDAAVGLAAGQRFGTVPGRVPAFLHEAYLRATGARRARVAVALARAWAYGGEPARAVGFAAEAIAAAEAAGDAALLADALDAQLLVHWGPDDLAARVAITRRLEDTAVHLTDVEARLAAHLWRLTTAVECLDLPTTQRQLRSLDALAEETGLARVRFFAVARRGMYALLTGDLEAAARARDAAVAAGTEAGEPDTLAIERTLSAGLALQAGDAVALAGEARLYEDYAAAEGYPSIAAKAALLWLAAGRVERAAALLPPLAGTDFGAVARDLDWLMTVTCLTEVAVGVGATELVTAAVPLLTPYTGRGVLNGGATLFLGVVDDYLARALRALGREPEAGERRDAAAAAYRRMAAPWWLARVTGPVRVAREADVVHLHPTAGGVWVVGRDAAAAALPGARGLHYLRLLLGRPGVEIAASELSAAVAGHPGATVAEGDLGPALDAQALAAYRRRLAEVDEELAEARAWADPGRADRLVAEREALLAEVARATGLGGRPRRGGDAGERARVAVRKAIAAAVARVDAVDPALARLLRDTVRTGAFCRYEPDPGRPVRWVLDAPRS